MGVNPTLWIVFTNYIYYIVSFMSNLDLYRFPYCFNTLVKHNHYSKRFSKVNMLGRRRYSSTAILKDFTKITKFHQWFVGFSDGESSFQVQIKYRDSDRNQIRVVNFSFTISLHIDDIAVLDYIKDNLKIGNITIKRTRSACVFSVTNKEGLDKLISIFDKYNLNTTKYLDYLDFKKAYYLYKDKNLNTQDNLNNNKWMEDIVYLKSRMNSQRTNLDVPASIDKTSINKNWLLGFIEAEGSFFLSRSNMEAGFSIELSKVQLFLLEKIKEFLIKDLEFDDYSLFQLKSSSFSIISINEQKVKPSAILLIKNIRLLNNYLVP